MGSRTALLIFAAAIPIVGATPTFAVQTSAHASREARLVEARELVALINPSAAMIEKNMQGWEAAIRKGSSLNPGVEKIEAEYPGAWDAAVDAARPVARDYLTKMVGEMLESKARLFAERLTSAELKEGIAFFASPPGKRFITGLVANADPSTIANQVAASAAESGQVRISSEDLNNVLGRAIRKTADASSAEDQIALLRFGQTPVASKLAQAGAEADLGLLERSNNPDPEWIRKQGEVMAAAMLQFVDDKKAD